MASSITTGMPKAPAHLTVEGRREWWRSARALKKLNMITTLDRAVFEIYCEAYGRMLRGLKVLAEQGETCLSAQGATVPRPEVQIVNKMMIECRACCKELGFTPSARGRMVLPEQSGEDEFDKEAKS